MANPLGYVLESITPLTQHNSAFLDLSIKNHLALANLTKGQAAKHDMLILVYAANMFEALCRAGILSEYLDLALTTQEAIVSIGKRKRDKNLSTWVCTAAEMQTLNDFLATHDEQLKRCTVKDIDNGNKIIKARSQTAHALHMV